MKFRTDSSFRERRYPVLTAIDLMLYWVLNVIAIGLSTVALKMIIVLVLQQPTVQLILHRVLG